MITCKLDAFRKKLEQYTPENYEQLDPYNTAIVIAQSIKEYRSLLKLIKEDALNKGIKSITVEQNDALFRALYSNENDRRRVSSIYSSSNASATNMELSTYGETKVQFMPSGYEWDYEDEQIMTADGQVICSNPIAIAAIHESANDSQIRVEIRFKIR